MMLFMFMISCACYAEVSVEQQEGQFTFGKREDVYGQSNQIAFRFDDYVSNPVPESGRLPGYSPGVFGSLCVPSSEFLGFVRPSEQDTSVRPLPQAVGVIVETKFWRILFGDFSKNTTTSDIRGIEPLMFRFVDTNDPTLAATVSCVGLRLGGPAVKKGHVSVTCYDINNNELYSGTIESESPVFTAKSNGRAVSAIHKLLFTCESDELWVIGSHEEDESLDDMFYSGFEVKQKRVFQDPDFLPNPFDPFEGRILDPRCKNLPSKWIGTDIVKLDDQTLLTGGGQLSGLEYYTMKTADDFKTLSEPRLISDGNPNGPGRPMWVHAIKTKSGAIVAVYNDLENQEWVWKSGDYNPEKLDLDVWTIRSLDGGKTWCDRQKIYDGYCGAIRDIKQTSSGHIVIPLSIVMLDPGRFATQVYVSADDGKTWKGSNIIDLGGKGNHGGAVEGTFDELSDGRLLLLLRTSWDRFWKAYSDDHGYSWRTIEPSNLDASSSCGYLRRLQSGRLVFAWNRVYPEGLTEEEKANYPRTDPKYGVTEKPASWHREELSIAFSQDDGQTWTNPVVIAKQKGAYLAYPYIIERRPGEIWLATQNTKYFRNKTKVVVPAVCVSFKETDFVSR